jgi:hypothetical protein
MNESKKIPRSRRAKKKQQQKNKQTNKQTDKRQTMNKYRKLPMSSNAPEVF